MIEPPVPTDLDLRAFAYMPLEVARLRDADITMVVTAEAFRAAVLLWCAAWHQVPASSLPDDERVLAKLAGFGRDVAGWRAVAEDALHGFVKCSDGRLYHSFIAEKALEAATKMRKQKSRTAAATAARLDRIKEKRNGQRDGKRNEHQRNGREENGKESTLPAGENARAQNDPVSRGVKLPIKADWTPNTIERSFAQECSLTDEETSTLALKFRAYYRANGELRASWTAQWERWCLDEKGGKRQALATALPHHEIDWDKAAGFYVRTRRWWRDIGPEPGQVGCRCAPDILKKHGIDPDTGELVPPCSTTVGTASALHMNQLEGDHHRRSRP